MSKLHRRAERASGRDWTQIVSRSGSSPRTRDHDRAEQRCSQNDRRQQTGRFSRRLQLGPGLEPPASWSLSPCCGPKFYLRADGRDTSRGPSFEFTAWSSSVAIELMYPMFKRDVWDLDPISTAKRIAAMNPPIEVESATWTAGARSIGRSMSGVSGGPCTRSRRPSEMGQGR